MSHDDRIRQLTGLFLEDLRAPIEASFRQLLADLMAMAAEDRTAAVNEALARADAERQAAVDAALADANGQHQAAVDAALAQANAAREQALDDLRTDLAKEHAAAIESLRADFTARHDDALGAERAELSRQHQEALAALEADLASRHQDALDAAREQATAQHDGAVQDLVRNREEALEASRRDAAVEREAAVQAVREELARDHETAMTALREQLQREHEEASARDREAWALEHEEALSHALSSSDATVSASIAAVEQERDAARATVAELTDQLAEARARHEQLVQIAHAEADAAAELSGDGIDTRVAERQSELACSDRLVTGVRALDQAGSLTQVLTALADHAATEGIRVGVLLVNGARLRGWRFAGMGDQAAGALDIAIDEAGVIGRAVQLGAPVSTTDEANLASAPLPSILSTPEGRVGLALPIIVGGRVVAVLYADDAGSEAPAVPSNWPEVIEVLARHAGRCLEVLTLARAASARPVGVMAWPAEGKAGALPHSDAGAQGEPGGSPHTFSEGRPGGLPHGFSDEAREEESARRHARLLISEIKLYNEELVERGRREGNLAALLGSEIERARRLYEEKIPAAVRQRVDCFDEEIVRTLAGGDRALLGQVT